MDSPRLSAGGVRFLDLHVPAAEFRLPSEDRRAYWTCVQTATGLPRFVPVRCDRGGCFLCSGVAGVQTRGQGQSRVMAGVFGSWLLTHYRRKKEPSIPAIFVDEASSEVHLRSPVRSSLRPVHLDGSGTPWALSLCCRTLRCLTLAGIRDLAGH